MTQLLECSFALFKTMRDSFICVSLGCEKTCVTHLFVCLLGSETVDKARGKLFEPFAPHLPLDSTDASTPKLRME